MIAPIGDLVQRRSLDLFEEHMPDVRPPPAIQDSSAVIDGFLGELAARDLCLFIAEQGIEHVRA